MASFSFRVSGCSTNKLTVSHCSLVIPTHWFEYTKLAKSSLHKCTKNRNPFLHFRTIYVQYVLNNVNIQVNILHTKHTTGKFGPPWRLSFCCCSNTAGGIAFKSQNLASFKKEFGRRHPPLLLYYLLVCAIYTFCVWPHDPASLLPHLRCRE